MGEADLGLVTLFGDFKSDFCAIPLALVFDETRVAVQDKPNDFFAGNEFRYPLFGKMDVGCGSHDRWPQFLLPDQVSGNFDCVS